ncbi:MAG: polysaccharide ABC transporter ATP-binding protein [Chromatiales bacterium]|jgi:lipopolysaccharide transport system ATP-binding protein|nr:polysaccharide ABC transporter ATP-binding protein [Chromatiales bacterium]MDX9768446.1 polysaccharide ABC transporter ATP-binding protein [Ectothiorhodospiraceae bacterium]
MNGSTPALRVDHLRKVYPTYASATDRLRGLLFNKPCHTDFVALQDVSFELGQGRCLGIVGDNGSGKSTLMQMIAGTLTPTSGRIERNGTVLGLLELGVGFHHEFTGRQNVFLYGDVLGISPALVRSKFDEIVEFSELGDFIDRPLKTYSTGMVMRLAYSTVTLLDPEILIIDEALSVGDAHFQKKCIDHIMRIKQKGRTIVFCSHSTYQVGMLCDETLWLKQGKVERFGETAQVIAAYEAYQQAKSEPADIEAASVEVPVRIAEVDILNPLPIERGDDLKVRIVTESLSDDIPFHVMLSIKFGSDYGVYATGTQLTGRQPLCGGRREIVVTYPNVPLMGGYYWLHVRILDDKGLMIYHEKTLLDPELEVRRDSLERGVCYLENHWEIR